jgi:hypothetical protein
MTANRWGLFFGSAFFAIPGVGPILVAGPLVAGIVGSLENALVVGGLSALGAGLYGLGIPKDSIVQYEKALQTDQFVLIAHGTRQKLPRQNTSSKQRTPLCAHYTHPKALRLSTNLTCDEENRVYKRASIGGLALRFL